ncbi:transposase, partial [Candidatus Protofrankia californiensis]|uniref:transposase n=1 Tax=Candidatus Protofrankia californiensis TaxID=1839754 RepID=UPI00104104C2
MAQNFRPVQRSQPFLLPQDMREWLPADHFANFVIELVESLDTSAFVNAYRADGKGGAAYHPVMMATLLVYAYCDGERSSRQIEQRCQTDITYRYLTGNAVPDHVTTARFRDRFETELADLFVPVLGICLNAGLGDLTLTAIDGTKLRCPASLRANRTLASIEKELSTLTDEIETELARIVAEVLAESHRADLDDDTLPGMPPSPPRPPGTLPPVSGLPKALHGKATRHARLTAARQTLDDGWTAEQAAHQDALRARGERIQQTGKGIRGRKPKPPERDPKSRVNVTDPESRVMKNVHGGYLQGYNAQNNAARDQLSLTAEVVNDENDYAQLRPMMTATENTLTGAGATVFPPVVTADAGYRTADVVAALDPAGPTVLVARR